MSIFGKVSVGAPAFQLTNVSYQYEGGITALDNISLSIQPGESVAVLGANGCGKSTLIRLLNGLIYPTAGTIRSFDQTIDEENLRNEQESYRFRRRVGLVFQNAEAQLFSPSVRDELAFGPLQLGFSASEIEQRTTDIAQLLQIENLLERPPFRLSGGEKRKVALGSVLILNPDVLLLDEPTTGLDPRSQRWLVDILIRLHCAGKTIITTTHDLRIVPEIAERALIFGEDHRLAAEGSSQQILEDLDLLLSVNLIHEHAHRHGDTIHSHPHFHDVEHAHPHPEHESLQTEVQ